MLNDREIREPTPKSKPCNVTDTGGLVLDVSPIGAKFWRVVYRDSANKVRTKTLGQYPTVSLVAARTAVARLKLEVECGVDLVAHGGDSSIRFADLVRQWYDLERGGWNARYAHVVWRRIEADLLPDLDGIPVASITAPDLLRVLRKMEARGALDVSKRLRQQVEDMLALAVATGEIALNPAAGLQRAMQVSPRVQHRLRLHEDQLPTFFYRLHADEGLHPGIRLGLKMAAHTALRTAELRLERWSEVDWAGKVWRIPAGRMKIPRPHVAPLTPSVITMLEQLQELAEGNEYIFPSPEASRRMSQPTSNNCLLYALYLLGYKGATTVHGFRGTFSTTANESEKWPREWIEAQPTHAKGDSVEAAYNVAQYMTQRRELMT